MCKPTSGCVRTACCSCCDKFQTSCNHLVTRFMTVTDLPQVVQTKYKLQLLRAQDVKIVETACCESVGLINLVTR